MSLKNEIIFGFFLLFLSAAYFTSAVEFQPKDITYSLTITTFKDNYENSLKPNFTGKLSIAFKSKNKLFTGESFQIILDASSKMSIKEAQLKFTSTYDSKEETVNGTHKNDKIIFNCPSESDNFLITIDYNSFFGNDMTGFYRSSYIYKNQTRWLLTTHFEPIFARKAFPCFDKPKFKAKFNLKVIIPKDIKDYKVLSNTPCKEEKNNEYSCQENKMKMSTYLFAFTITDFNHTEKRVFQSINGNDKKYLQTYGQNNLIVNESKLSLDVGIEALNKLKTYLNMDYGFEKVDQVGIPDFSAGAMENWGLILYREKSLFFNEKTNSILTKQRNTLTITHELVHQWFGNLVTLESWDYIWLNEAFATYLEYIIANEFENPNTTSWKYMNQLLVNEIHSRAFETDGLVSSNPLTHTIEDESLIFSHFNDIPYSKGCAVLRMWDLSLPAKKFQESLKKYINQRKENTANPQQLYDAFKEISNMNEGFFFKWTTISGYPVVEVKKIKDEYILSQFRFLYEKSNNNFANFSWTIPITYTRQQDKKTWSTVAENFFQPNESFKIKANGSWIIINNQQAGYYRVNYEKENWDALSDVLNKNFMEIHELNRAQLINDVFSLARSLQKNYVSYSTALAMSNYLKKETSYAAWKTALNAFEFLQTKLYGDDKIYNDFKSHILELIKPHFNNFNLMNLSHIEIVKGIEISRWLCSLNYEPCVSKALNLYKEKIFDPNIQEIILCTAVRKQKEAWTEVFSKYLQETDNGIKVMYLSVLGCAENKDTIKLFLNKTLNSNSEIRKQDLIYVLSSVYEGSLKNTEVAFEFIIENFKYIAKEFGGINPLGRALLGISKKLSSPNDLTRMNQLVKEIEASEESKAAIENAKTALSIMESNIAWNKDKKNQLYSYFNTGAWLSYSISLVSVCFIFVFQL